MACIALGLGLSAAQADQLPNIPPPPSPSESDPGGDGSAAGYPDATENQAENLFTTEFSDTVASLAAGSPDLGPNADFLNDRTAIVSSGKGPAELQDEIQRILDQDQGDIDAARSDIQDLVDAQNSGTPKLVSSTLPLRTVDGAGQQAPVDLSLDPQSGGYVPDNPLVDLKLPADVSNDVTVGDQGIKVDVGATTNATADTISGGDNLFYHEAATDTDVVLAPLSVGFETLYQLRSPQSPKDLTMSFTLPTGASLQDATGGGAQIVKDGQTLATVSAPTAVDAAGNEVSVTTSVSGHSLEIHVAHQNADFAYPINVDPVTDAYTGSNGGIGAFSANWSSGQSSGSAYQMGTTCVQNVSCTSGTTGPRGLYIHAPTNQTYSSGQAANWVYLVPHWAPSTAYISSLTLGPMDYDRHSGTATNPYLAAGILSSSLTWVNSMTQSTNMDDTYWIMGNNNQTTGKVAVFQMYAGATQSLTHWRHAFLSGVQMSLSDTDSPTVNVDTSPLTSGWIDGNHTTTFQVPVADGGLGVASVWVPYNDSLVTTTFQNQNGSPSGPCEGTRVSPCPQSATATGHYNANQMPEGQSQSFVIALDALGKAGLQVWYPRVDSSPPTVTLSGGLVSSGDRPLTGPSYNLQIAAVDGDGSSWPTARSGVDSVEIKVDGQRVDYASQACPNGSCPMSRSYTLNTDSYPDGEHSVTVVVHDALDHTTTKNVSIEIDREGDIIHGTQYDGNPAQDGNVLKDEWAQPLGHLARHEAYTVGDPDPSTISTRNSVPCPSDATAVCDQVRTAHQGDPPYYAVYTGSGVNDPNLDQISALKEVASGGAGNTPDGHGATSAILAGWQELPPGAGSTYDLYESHETALHKTGEDADGSDISEAVTVVNRTWVDSATQLPLKDATFVQGTGEDLGSDYWSYEPRRLTETDLPAGFFAVDAPGARPADERVTYHGADPVGAVSDTETGQPIQPYTLGTAPTLPNGNGGSDPYCLESTDVVRFAQPGESLGSGSDPSSPAEAPDAAGPETLVAANYLRMDSGDTCVPGARAGASPDVDVISLASSGSTAAAATATYTDAVDPAMVDDPADGPVGTARAASVAGNSTTAYVLPAGPDMTSSLLMQDSTTMIVEGPFDPNAVTNVAAQLEPR